MEFRTFLLPILLATQTTFAAPAMAENCKPGVADLTDHQVKAIQMTAGGEQQYRELMTWAGENLPESETDKFNSMVACGNAGRIMNGVIQIQAIQQIKSSRLQPMTNLEIVQLLKF